MSDITVTINPPQTTSITVAGGVLPHNLTHAPAGSDSLSTWYASVDNLAYVSGQIGAPAGVVYTTGNQDVSGVKNFYSRPTVDGSGVMLSGEIAGTGYLTGYVQTSQTGSFVTSGNTGNFVTSTQTGQLTGVFYPYTGNPAAYVQGAVVRPSNTGNFVDTHSFQIISGLKSFTKTITAPTGTFGNSHSLGGSNADGQTVCGGTANTTRNSHSSVLGGMLNFATENYSCVAGGVGNIASGQSAFIGGGSGNIVEDCIGVAVVGGENNSSKLSNYSFVGGGIQNSIYNSSQSRILGGVSNVISGGNANTVFGEQSVLTDCGSSISIGFLNTLTNCNNAIIVGNAINASNVDGVFVASSESSAPSGSNTAVITYGSGIYLNGPTHFDNRPQVSGVGLQTTGEYAEFNLWDEFSGALYPYPKNALNRSYNILKHAENNSGPSGETIWYNLPQWTGDKPVGTGISSFYNTGFWARDYDWSCVSFQGARTNSGNPSSPLTLISPRHALGVVHAGDSPGAKCAFVSNVETGYTWEATIASTTTLSGDARLYTFTQDAPSVIRPASIMGSSPTSAWGVASLLQTRVLTVKDSTVLADILGAISSGAGFQSGSLVVEHTYDPGARYTGVHVGGDSSSPVFLPLEDGRLVFIGAASSTSSVAFIGDPRIRSGIGFATSGYSIDTWNVPRIQVSALLPTSGQINKIGTSTNKWYEANISTIHATNLYGDLPEYEVYPYNEYLGGESLIVNPTDYHGLTYNTENAADLNTINFSGTYPDTFWIRFVIPNSGASINFSSSGPELLMPNGSGFSGVGYVIEARGMGNNKLLIQPISAPSGAYGGGSTGYLTGYVNKSETGNFYPRSNPSGYITGVDLSSYATTGYVTGVSGYLESLISASVAGVGSLNGLSGVLTIAGAGNNSISVTGSTITVSGNTGFLVNYQQTGNYITSAQTGDFYAASNPASYITAAALFPYATTAVVTGVSGYLQGQITSLQSATGNINTRLVAVEGVTGSFVTGSVVRPSETGSFITSSQTGVFYPINNPSGFITGVDLSSYATTTFVTGISGYHSGLINALQSSTGSINTRLISVEGVTGSFALKSQTGAFLTTGAADARYALQSATGDFITSSQTGAFYPSSNPSGFATITYTTGISGYQSGLIASLQSTTGNLNTRVTSIEGVTGTFALSANTGSFLTTGAADNRYFRAPYIAELYVDAGAMLTGLSGALPTTATVNSLAYDGYDFDPTTTGYSQFKVTISDYNLGDIKAKFVWTAAATGSVVWGIQSFGVGDGESMNPVWSVAQEITDTHITGSGLHKSASTAAFIPSGSIQSGDSLFFRIYRNASSVSDTISTGAILLGLSLQYTGASIPSW